MRRRRLWQDGSGNASRLQGGAGRKTGRDSCANHGLAFQHLKTLRDRFAGFPLAIDMVSRFRQAGDERSARAARQRARDVIVGTHRLLSKDVRFKDLGLLVVDEEQRFGVVHKERIKQMRKRVDVLTMTATPIRER